MESLSLFIKRFYFSSQQKNLTSITLFYMEWKHIRNTMMMMMLNVLMNNKTLLINVTIYNRPIGLCMHECVCLFNFMRGWSRIDDEDDLYSSIKSNIKSNKNGQPTNQPTNRKTKWYYYYFLNFEHFTLISIRHRFWFKFLFLFFFYKLKRNLWINIYIYELWMSCSIELWRVCKEWRWYARAKTLL